MERPKVCVLKTDGINCDEETSYAFELAGAAPEIVHINRLVEQGRGLKDYQILAISGGFSYGDNVRAGIILATELNTKFKDEMEEFREKGGLGIGICNGFQVLTETGLLPGPEMGKVTLANNKIGHFRCDWVNLSFQYSRAEYLRDLDWDVISLMVAHGEGRFQASEETLTQIERANMVTLRYVDSHKIPTLDYPDNPNASLNAIAGITDPTGRILGMMPHPERFVRVEQHPNWRRPNGPKAPQGLPIFEKMVDYVLNS